MHNAYIEGVFVWRSAHRYRVQVPSCSVRTGMHAVCDCEGLNAVLC